jgi:hypothetical protein
MNQLSSWKDRVIATGFTHVRRFSARLFNPGSELLEDRTVLSPYLVTTTADDGKRGRVLESHEFANL